MLTTEGGNSVSRTTIKNTKTFRRDDEDASPYITLQIVCFMGANGGNSTKGYENYILEVLRWTRVGSKIGRAFGTQEELLKLFNDASDYGKAGKLLNKITKED